MMHSGNLLWYHQQHLPCVWLGMQLLKTHCCLLVHQSTWVALNQHRTEVRHWDHHTFGSIGNKIHMEHVLTCTTLCGEYYQLSLDKFYIILELTTGDSDTFTANSVACTKSYKRVAGLGHFCWSVGRNESSTCTLHWWIPFGEIWKVACPLPHFQCAAQCACHCSSFSHSIILDLQTAKKKYM